VPFPGAQGADLARIVELQMQAQGAGATSSDITENCLGARFCVFQARDLAFVKKKM
jgi:hypothetical protein